MSHEISHTDGEYAFVSANTDAWHRLGTTFNGLMTAEEVLRESHLAGWNVRKVPVFASIPEEITDNGVSRSTSSS